MNFEDSNKLNELNELLSQKDKTFILLFGRGNNLEHRHNFSWNKSLKKNKYKSVNYLEYQNNIIITCDTWAINNATLNFSMNDNFSFSFIKHNSFDYIFFDIGTFKYFEFHFRTIGSLYKILKDTGKLIMRQGDSVHRSSDGTHYFLHEYYTIFDSFNESFDIFLENNTYLLKNLNNGYKMNENSIKNVITKFKINKNDPNYNHFIIEMQQGVSVFEYLVHNLTNIVQIYFSFCFNIDLNDDNNIFQIIYDSIDIPKYKNKPPIILTKKKNVNNPYFFLNISFIHINKFFVSACISFSFKMSEINTFLDNTTEFKLYHDDFNSNKTYNNSLICNDDKLTSILSYHKTNKHGIDVYYSNILLNNPELFIDNIVQDPYLEAFMFNRNLYDFYKVPFIIFTKQIPTDKQYEICLHRIPNMNNINYIIPLKDKNLLFTNKIPLKKL